MTTILVTSLRSIFRTFVLITLLFAAISSAFGAETPTHSAPPLVTIRFNQPQVDFEQQLYDALAQAVAAKPDLMIDLVTRAPTSGGGTTVADKQWQATAGRNTRTVIAAMERMGVPVQRISVTGQFAPSLSYDETQVFVR